MARAARPATRRRSALRDRRPNARTSVVSSRRPHRATASRCARRRPPAFRSAPAPARPRRGDGPRRRPAPGHPKATRARPPRHHQHLSPRHRHQRNYRDHPRPPPADASGERWATTLNPNSRFRIMIIPEGVSNAIENVMQVPCSGCLKLHRLGGILCRDDLAMVVNPHLPVIGSTIFIGGGHAAAADSNGSIPTTGHARLPGMSL